MKTALVYDWFADCVGGGEKAFEAIYELFPGPIYTLLRSEESTRGTAFENAAFHPSFIQRFPWALKKYRSYLPFYPLAIEQLDLSAYDVILSCSHCVAKGVLTHAEQIHLCYCCTPMRYAWDLHHQYLQEANLKKGLKGRLAQMILHYLRLWDVQSSGRVDAFAAISHHVARRIKKTYGREAKVIYPPVNVEFFGVREKKEDFYVTASRFVPYKRVDLIVEAFAGMPERRLVVVGDGPDWEKVKAKAGKNVELVGRKSDEELRDLMQRAKGFLFAALEDFGIVPVEAQACGTPVIAYGKGGALETVVDGKTGIFFGEQSAGAIREAVERFEGMEFDFREVRRNAERFSKERFAREFQEWVRTHLEKRELREWSLQRE